MATYHVRNGGSDSNDGLSDATAFATPQKAYDVSIPGDILALKYGSVWNTTLNLSKNTATVENPIQFQSYGDTNLPKPEITGAKVLTGWVSVGGGLYRYTDSAITVRISCLSFDAVSQPKGMIPRGLDYYQSTGATGSESGTITDTVRMSTFGNLAGAEVISRKEHWILDRGTVTSQSGNTINFSGMGSYNIKTNWGYKLQNKAQFCTQLGDWYQDGTSIYVYFGANDPDNYDVRISFRPHCINVNGTGKYTYFENINFTYFNGREDEPGNAFGSTFYFQFSPGHKFTSCDFRFHGKTLLYHYMSPFLELSFCNVEDIMDNFWFNRYGNNQGTDLKLHRCVIRRIGDIPGAGGNGDGRYTAFNTVSSGDRIEVTQNLFEDIGYNGCVIGGYNYLVQNNLFIRCNKVKDDGGCIYTFKGTNNLSYDKNKRKILNNICLDSPGAPKGKWNGFNDPNYKGAGKGIYIDDNQVLNSPDNITIHHNIVARCGDGMMSHNNEGLDIQYNIFYDNHDVQFKSQDDNLGVVANRNNIFKNNICYAKDSSQYVVTVHAIDGVFNHGDWNDNYYMRPTNEAGLIRTTTNGATFTNYSLAQWKATGRDLNSKGTPTTSTLSELVLNDDFEAAILHTPTRVKLDKDGIEVEEPFYLLPFEGKLLLDDLRAVDDPEPDPEQPDPNTKPELTIVSPATGSEFEIGNPINFVVNTYDVDTPEYPLHVVKQLDLYYGGEPIEKRTDPIQGDNIFVWENPPVGNYVITAVATDSLEGVGSRTITISVINPDPDPEPVVYNIVVTIIGSGSVLGDGTYEEDQEITLTADPDLGWSFLHWTDIDGVYLENPLTFIAEENRDLDAVFIQDTPPPIDEYTVTVVQTTGGAVTGGGEYEDGSQATLTATPNTGWHFVRWSNDVTDNPYSFPVTGDVTLQASFAQDEPVPGVIIVKGKFRIV